MCAMWLRNWAGRRVIFPLIEKISATRCWTLARHTKKEHDQGYPSDLVTHQKLQNLLLAAQTTPSWKHIISSHQQVLQELPVTHKINYIQGFPEQVTRLQNKHEHQTLSSGGTSERMTVMTDFAKRDCLRALENLNVEYSHGSLWARKTLDIPPSACNVTCGLVDKGPQGILGFLFWATKYKQWRHPDTIGNLRGRVERQGVMRRVTAEPFTPGSWVHLCAQIDPLIEKLATGNFEILRGYPLFIYWIAQRVKEKRINLPALTTIIPYGGLAGESMIAFSNAHLGTRFINLYGTGEVGSIGISPHAQHPVSIYQHDIIVEIVNEQGDVVSAPGIKGDVLITDLNNLAMPILRYAVGDTGSWESLEDGTQGLLLHGRKIENINLDKQTVVTARMLQDCLFADPNIINFSLHQDVARTFTLNVVLKAPKTTPDFAELQRMLMTQQKGQLQVRTVDFISPAASGKYLHFLPEMASLSAAKPSLKHQAVATPNGGSASFASQDFPLRNKISPNGHAIRYLDNAATTPKPHCVIEAAQDVMCSLTGNVHRGAHFLGDAITDKFEQARASVARFIGANPNEIVFLRNTTECINLIAQQPDCPRVINSLSDHHANHLPWRNKITLPLDADGSVSLDALSKAAAGYPGSLITLTHISNVTGNLVDVAKVSAIAKAHHCRVLLDAAQSAPHIPIAVHDMDVDYLVFSGHKIGGPSGVGVLWINPRALHTLKPIQWGGSMVDSVTSKEVTLKPSPWCFEAGTPAMESIVGLGAAAEWLMRLGMQNVHTYVNDLTQHTRRALQAEYGDIVLGSKTAPGPITLNLPNHSPHSVAKTLSERYGICVRAGFHCAQPLHAHLKSQGTLRISPWLINNQEDMDMLILALRNTLSDSL
jgi:cysteine desulfurase/selenocysteine lyase